MTLAERDTAFAQYGDHTVKTRIVVVLRVAEPDLVVISPTTQSGSGDGIVVEPRTRWGKALGLNATSYFRASEIRVIVSTALRPRAEKCPIDLFHKLRALLEDAAALPRAEQTKS